MKLLDILFNRGSKKETVQENSEGTYEYGCAMLYFNLPQLRAVQKQIDTQDIFHGEPEEGLGLEDEPHTTLLYGIHKEVPFTEIISKIKGVSFGECLFHNVSIFQNERYDVLKFEVEGKGLRECNEALKDLPHTTSYPDYNPHLTIGYVKPGTGKKYVENFKDITFEKVPAFGLYSHPTQSKQRFLINKYQ